MTQSLGNRTLYILGVLFFGLLIVGCGGVIEFPFNVTKHPASDKFNLKIQLVITPQLLEAQWTSGIPGTNIILLGEPFSQNAEHLARKLFREVHVSKPADPQLNVETDGILTPKMVSLRHTPGMAGFDSQTTVIFEWRLTDSEKNIVWVKSLTSKILSTAPGLGGIDSGNREHVTLVVNDLFKQSFEAMTSSPEIKEFSESQ